MSIANMNFYQWINSILLIFILAGCATTPRKVELVQPYEARLLIGQQRKDALVLVEKVFGEPEQIGNIFGNSDYEVEVRRYLFTNVSDFVVYFHQDVFIQAGLMPVNSPEYPALRADYQGITPDKPGPVLGYSIFMDDHEIVLDTLQPEKVGF